MSARMPTFLVVGAGRSGTTSCYFYLKAHPEIFMSPIKEPRFFAYDGSLPKYNGPDTSAWVRNSVLELGAYQRLFDGVTDERAIGEASIQYLSYPGAPERIRAHIPEARIIALLRDPADRAYSHFLFLTRDRFEPEHDFVAALDAEPGRIRDGWHPGFHYATHGLYHRHLSRFYALFDREQIRAYLYEDLQRDAARVLRDMYGFVGTSPDFAPDLSRRYNPSGVPKSSLLFRFYRTLAEAMREKERHGLIPTGLLDARVVSRAAGAYCKWILNRPRMPDEARVRLRSFFREDTLRLQDLIGRDLSHWL